jgi:hypothetical protein
MTRDVSEEANASVEKMKMTTSQRISGIQYSVASLFTKTA